MIYFDYAATTPMGVSAIEAYKKAATEFYGNANSLHDTGSEAGRALAGSRKLIAAVMNVPFRGVRFTGSGSEASFLSLVSLAQANRHKGRHLITTNVEHSSIRNTISWLEKQGFSSTILPVNSEGVAEPEKLKRALREDTILVSIQYVNSETGTIQPLREIGDILSGHQAVFHSDMVQGFCKLPMDPVKWNINGLSVSAHKIHGPKGLGAAYIDPGTSWKPFIPDTIHENGFRPGTVDVPAIVSFAAAAREMHKSREENLKHVSAIKNTLLSELTNRCENVTLIGDPEAGSPYIAGLSIYGMEGQFAMLECSQRGLAISTGSACQVNEQKPSPALLAMGRSEQEATSFIRLSFDWTSSMDEVKPAVEILSDVIHKHLSVARL